MAARIVKATMMSKAPNTLLSKSTKGLRNQRQKAERARRSLVVRRTTS